MQTTSASRTRSFLVLCAVWGLASALAAQRFELPAPMPSAWSSKEGNQDIHRLLGRVGIGTTNPNDTLTVRGGLTMMGVDPLASAGRIWQLEEISTFFPVSGAGGFVMRGAYPWSNGFKGMPRADVLRYDGNTLFCTDEFGSPLGKVGIGTRDPKHRLAVKGDISLEGVDPGTSDGCILEIQEISSYLPASGAGGFLMRAAYPWSNGFRGRPRAHVLRYDGNTVFATDDNGSALGNVGIGTRSPKARLHVEGNAKIGGTVTTDVLTITGGSDIVEQFETSDPSDLAPGMVVVIDSEREGQLTASSSACDRRVAGVVAGAGGVKPGLSLSQKNVLEGDVPVTLLGRTYVWCSAENGPIVPGDRLTTSTRRGMAMRASEDGSSEGAILGQAMSSLGEDSGLVLVLIR